MYYIYSFIISIIIYFVLHTFYKTKDKLDTEKKDESVIENIFTFFVIYLIITVLCYFMEQHFTYDIIENEYNNLDIGKPIKSNVDINLFKKIPEDVNTGFTINDTSGSDSE